jgi:hypothetical protein
MEIMKETIEAERGRTISSPLRWVDFVVRNPDILAVLSPSPLRARRISDGKFHLTIFRVSINLEEVHHEINEQRGALKLFSSIRRFGKTHTICKYSYAAIDEDTTALDLSITIELTTFRMRVYAWLFRKGAEHYMNKICLHVETAAKLLAQGNEKDMATLDQEQQNRVTEMRRSLSRQIRSDARSFLKFEGAMRVTMSDSSLVLAAEARMPDQRILTANSQLNLGLEEKQSLLSGLLNLATINSRAVRSGASTPSIAADVNFRQAALEYGYQFYQRVCSNQLSTVVPVITSQGQAAYFRIIVEGEAEQLPWEVMHDGQEFVCIKTCLSRSITTLRQEAAAPRDWGNQGILIVGADSRGDLPGVEQETKGVGRFLASAGAPRVEVLTGPKANRKSVMRALQSGEFGVLHFSGHSVFDQEHPYQSTMDLCSGTQIFLHELGHVGRASNQDNPLGFVFLNSCQSARVGQDAVTGRQLSMCKALREAGVSYVIGMLWSVEDEAAVQVGANFYKHLLNQPHKGPESAMRETRLAVAIERTWSDGSWLAPVLYS